MLNYQIYGELDSGVMPLVVMHGLLGEKDNWRTFARKMQQDRPIVAIDMRNHGDSPHVAGMSYGLMTEDVLEVLGSLNLSQVNLMGHSMGGKVAMWLALNHPELIQQLVVVDIAPVNYPPRHQGLLQAMLTMPIAGFSRRKEADDWLAPTIKHPVERGFLLKNLKTNEHGKFDWQCNLPEIARHYLKLTAFPATELTYDGPVLFIDGGHSDYVTAETWDVAQQHFPSAIRVTIESAGHLPHVEAPDEFVKEVRKVL